MLDAVTDEVTPAESSPAPEVAEPTAADTGQSEEAALKSATQKRIDKLTWEKGERDREIAYWRQLAMQKAEQPEAPKVEAKGPPTLAQFEYDEAKYQAAVLEFTQSEARRVAQEAIASERERDRNEGRVKSFKTREAEFSAKNPDYQEKVYDSSLPITPVMVELIAESPEGPAVALYLANHRDEAAQIAALPPLMVAKEMGRIEAKLSMPKAAPAPVSKAPAPPPKIDAVEPDVRKSLDDPSITDAEFAKIRKRQIAQRR